MNGGLIYCTWNGQEGRKGLREAAAYIRKELHQLKDRAQPNIRLVINYSKEVDCSNGLAYSETSDIVFFVCTLIIMNIDPLHLQHTNIMGYCCLWCRVEMDDNVVGGSFNMMFLGHGISLAYRNHTNVVMRYEPVLLFWIYFCLMLSLLI